MKLNPKFSLMNKTGSLEDREPHIIRLSYKMSFSSSWSGSYKEAKEMQKALNNFLKEYEKNLKNIGDKNGK